MLHRLYQVTCALLVLTALTAAPVQANLLSQVVINGQRLTAVELTVLEAQLGGRIPPGAYLLNAQGCWMNLSTGQSGCLGASGDVHSRYGSGERTSDGSWNHYSNSAGMGVGGTADGCIYTTTGWSNC